MYGTGPAPPLRASVGPVRGGDGQQCRRRTFRHPFCSQHGARPFGVTVRRSRVHGCGLFAVRAFRAGEVMLPYTGETRAVLQQPVDPGLGERTGSPYAFAHARPPAEDRRADTLPGRGRTLLVDAACSRGWAAYANHSDHPNVQATAAVLEGPESPAWGPTDPSSGLRRVLPRRGSAYHRSGWRYIPALFVDRFQKKNTVWLSAVRNIAAGEEILLDYGDPEVLRVRHRTAPLPC